MADLYDYTERLKLLLYGNHRTSPMNTKHFDDNAKAIDLFAQEVDSHMENTTMHITSSERSKWDGAVKFVSLPVSGWNSNTQTVTVDGITVSSNPTIDVQIESTAISDIKNAITEFAKIIYATTGDNSMTFYCSEVPTNDLTIILKGW